MASIQAEYRLHRHPDLPVSLILSSKRQKIVFMRLKDKDYFCPRGTMTRLNRTAAAKFLGEHGLPIAPTTLAKKAVDGSGPPYQLWNGQATYDDQDLLAWAASRLGPKLVAPRIVSQRRRRECATNDEAYQDRSLAPQEPSILRSPISGIREQGNRPTSTRIRNASTTSLIAKRISRSRSRLASPTALRATDVRGDAPRRPCALRRRAPSHRGPLSGPHEVGTIYLTQGPSGSPEPSTSRPSTIRSGNNCTAAASQGPSSSAARRSRGNGSRPLDPSRPPSGYRRARSGMVRLRTTLRVRAEIAPSGEVTRRRTSDVLSSEIYHLSSAVGRDGWGRSPAVPLPADRLAEFARWWSPCTFDDFPFLFGARRRGGRIVVER